MAGSFMRRSLVIAAMAFIPLAAAAMGAAGMRGAAKPPVPPIIATIKLWGPGGVIQGLDEYKALKAEVAKKADDFQKSLAAKEKSIKDNQTIYENKPAGPDKKAMAQQIIRDALQYKFDKEYAKQFVDQMEGEQLADIADRVMAACQTLAQNNHYTIVMADDADMKPSRGGKDEVAQGIAMKRLWYVNPDHDVTQE